MGSVYKMHDSDPLQRGMTRISLAEASEANANGFGIFQTVNTFRGARRIQNLVSIDAWAIDIDTGSKESQWEKIQAGLVPTLVVETKRGFQVYWKAVDARPEHWNSLVLDRLVAFYGADKNARDMARVLRVPGFYHLKDPTNPFLVQKILSTRASYREADIARFYPDTGKEKREAYTKQHKEILRGSSQEFWAAVYNMDCVAALERISGTHAMGGECVEFKPTTNGNLNIYIDNKGTSCWIDSSQRIGSLDGGGPTIWNWINWYHRDHKKTAQIMREFFKELPWNK